MGLASLAEDTLLLLFLAVRLYSETLALLGCNEDCVCVATTARMRVPFVTPPTTRVELQIESNKDTVWRVLAVSTKVTRPGLASP